MDAFGSAGPDNSVSRRALVGEENGKPPGEVVATEDLNPVVVFASDKKRGTYVVLGYLTLGILASPLELQGLKSCLVAEDEFEVELEEKEDGNKNDHIQHDSPQNDQQGDDDAEVSASELVNEDPDGAEEGDEGDEGHQDGVEQHQQEKLPVVEADAGVDPGTE